METCAMCHSPMTACHLVSIDMQQSFRLCCLCVGELLAKLAPEVPAGA